MKERSKKEIATLVDRGAHLHEQILKDEESQREIRARLMKAGRPDLAQKFLSAPVALRDLAGVLWRGEALVTFSTPETEEPVSAVQYPKKFTLKRRSHENWRQVDENWYRQFGRHVLRIWTAKTQADLTQRTRAAAKRGGQNVIDSQCVLRQLAIELAPVYPLEEWACIFPQAVSAGDAKFMEEIIASHRRERTPLSKEYSTLAIFWHGFHAAGYEAKVPPLKYWSDKSAWQFVQFATGNDKLTLSNYQQHKARSGLHSKKPVLVTFADYSNEGTIERLVCRR
jgi:hypothetical protein